MKVEQFRPQTRRNSPHRDGRHQLLVADECPLSFVLEVCRASQRAAVQTGRGIPSNTMHTKFGPSVRRVAQQANHLGPVKRRAGNARTILRTRWGRGREQQCRDKAKVRHARCMDIDWGDVGNESVGERGGWRVQEIGDGMMVARHEYLGAEERKWHGGPRLTCRPGEQRSRTHGLPLSPRVVPPLAISGTVVTPGRVSGKCKENVMLRKHRTMTRSMVECRTWCVCVCGVGRNEVCMELEVNETKTTN